MQLMRMQSNRWDREVNPNKKLAEHIIEFSTEANDTRNKEYSFEKMFNEWVSQYQPRIERDVKKFIQFKTFENKKQVTSVILKESSYKNKEFPPDSTRDFLERYLDQCGFRKFTREFCNIDNEYYWRVHYDLRDL